MATIYTDLDTRSILRRRFDAAMRAARVCRELGKLDKAAVMLGLAGIYRVDYARELRMWRENDMVLIDGAIYTQSGGNAALAARRAL
jgi:hypothetical protein